MTPQDAGAQVRLATHGDQYREPGTRRARYFARAAGHYRRALDRLEKLSHEDRLEGRPLYKIHRIKWLKADLALCEAAPTAAGRPQGSAFAVSPGKALPLVLLAWRAMTAKAKLSETLDAASALCELRADLAEDLYLQAHDLAIAINLLGKTARWIRFASLGTTGGSPPLCRPRAGGFGPGTPAGLRRPNHCNRRRTGLAPRAPELYENQNGDRQAASTASRDRSRIGKAPSPHPLSAAFERKTLSGALVSGKSGAKALCRNITLRGGDRWKFEANACSSEGSCC